MNTEVRRSAARWRVPERRALRPVWWGIALAVVGMLLVEVWQSSRMAELCLDLARNRAEVQQAQARLEYLQAELDRRTTLANLAPQAGLLGLGPADDKQVVQLPPEYLAAADPRAGSVHHAHGHHARRGVAGETVGQVLQHRRQVRVHPLDRAEDDDQQPRRVPGDRGAERVGGRRPERAVVVGEQQAPGEVHPLLADARVALALAPGAMAQSGFWLTLRTTLF